MIKPKIALLPHLDNWVQSLQFETISKERQSLLQSLIDYIQQRLDHGEIPKLNFICTHNSRRSQFSQIWAQTAADYYGIDARCYSGGVEVTAFNERAVAAVERAGFKVIRKGEGNPIYFVFHSEDSIPIIAFSKVFDDAFNPSAEFAAVMTCSHADENCPYIAGAEVRLPLRYIDPKAADGTPQEGATYDERGQQIGKELFYVFSRLRRG